jgi:hypothetical protein
LHDDAVTTGVVGRQSSGIGGAKQDCVGGFGSRLAGDIVE